MPKKTKQTAWTPQQEAWIEAKREAAADSAFLFGLVRTHDLEQRTEAN